MRAFVQRWGRLGENGRETNTQSKGGQRDKMRRVRHRSKWLLPLIGLFCVVFGTSMLTVVVFTKPWVKKPRIAAKSIRRPIQSTEREAGILIQGVPENQEMGENAMESGILEEEKDPSSKTQEPSMIIPGDGIDEKVVVVRGPKLPKTGKIAQILVDKEEKVIHVTLIGDRKIGDYNAFKVKNPPRLVIDIWNVQTEYPKSLIQVDHPLLKRVRLEKHSEKTRFVFESTRPQVPLFRVRRVGSRLVVSFGQVYPP